MDAITALRLVGKGKAFDEAAVRQGLERKGAYQLDAFPQFNEAMAEVQQGGPAVDAMFADMIRYYTEGNTPAPVPASRASDPREFLNMKAAEALLPRMAKAKETRANLSSNKKEAQDYSNEYVEDMMVSMPEPQRDDMDDYIILAALGSMLGGAGAKEATKEEEQ